MRNLCGFSFGACRRLFCGGLAALCVHIGPLCCGTAPGRTQGTYSSVENQTNPSPRTSIFPLVGLMSKEHKRPYPGETPPHTPDWTHVFGERVCEGHSRRPVRVVTGVDLSPQSDCLANRAIVLNVWKRTSQRFRLIADTTLRLLRKESKRPAKTSLVIVGTTRPTPMRREGNNMQIALYNSA